MIGPLSYLDAALLALGLISALLAMYRGLMRELLSIVSWIVAAGAAFIAFKRAQDSIGPEIAKQIGVSGTNGAIVGGAAVAAVTFLIVLIIVHLLTTRISDAILDSSVGMIDRMAGFVFGFIRGALIIVIVFMLYEAGFPEPEKQFPWVKQSKSLPFIRGPGNWIKGLLTQHVLPLFEKQKAGEQQGFLDTGPERLDRVRLSPRYAAPCYVTLA
jgi:membrane protein required for colicin V production